MSNTNPIRLSIVIPALNEAEVIERLLISLQPARQQGIELILVDGGSSDGTADRAKGLVDHLLRTAPGRALQMNAGAGLAAGTVLWFLHADSRVDATCCQQVIASVETTGQAWGRFDVRLSAAGPLLRMVAVMMNWRSRLTGIATGDQGIFVDRQLFESIDGFPPIPLMEDIRISQRLKRFSAPICLRHRLVVSSRRWQRNGVVRTILQMWRLRLAFYLGADPAVLARRYN